MNRSRVFIIALITAMTMIRLSGCSDDDRGTIAGDSDTQVPKIVEVYPVDGAGGVSTTASIGIKFNVPMDTSSVTLNFHLSGGSEMHAWMDSLDHHTGIGGTDGMNMIDMDHLMEWMDDIQYSGHFSWGITKDSCEFIPDSSFIPNTDYMIFINDDIRGHNSMMMDRRRRDYDAYIYHFVTGL